MFNTPKSRVSSSANLRVSTSDTADASIKNITRIDVDTPKNPVFDRDSILNALRNSQGQFSPVYNKRLDRFALEERIRAHSDKHIMGKSDDISLLNKDAKKLNDYLISKGFNLEQDATFFLNEEDAVTVIHEIINSEYGDRARKKFVKENSARITFKILTKHLSNKLAGMQFCERLPNSTVMKLNTLEAVVIILENNKENPDTFFCQTIFPIGTNKLQTFLKESKEQIFKRLFVKNKMPFRRMLKENIHSELMKKEDFEIVENYCENYNQYFKELHSKELSQEFSEQDLGMLFKKCSEVDQHLLDEVISRYLNAYMNAYRAQMQDINFNGNIREYNYHCAMEGYLKHHSYYVPKVIPFRHFPTIGSPTAVAIKGCKNTQVKRALAKHYEQVEPVKRLQNLLNESYSNNPTIKKEVIIKDLREILSEDGQSMYVLQQFFLGYSSEKSHAIKQIVRAIDAYATVSLKGNPVDPLQDTKKTKENLEIYLHEIEELVRNYETHIRNKEIHGAAKSSFDSAVQIFSDFFRKYANAISNLFETLNKVDLKKIDKKALLDLFFEHDKEETNDLLEWALQQKKSEENSNKNKENINLSNLMSFSEIYSMLNSDKRLKALEYIKDVLIARRKSRLVRTMNNINLGYNVPSNFKKPLYLAAIQVLTSLNRSFKDLIKIDITLLKESVERSGNLSLANAGKGYNDPYRIKNIITIVKSNLLRLDSSGNNFEEKLLELKKQATVIEYLSIRMRKLFTLWRNEDTFSSIVVNHLFQSEMEILNEKRMKNILLQVKKDLDNLCLVVQAIKPFYDDPNAEEIAAAKLEISNSVKKVQEISRRLQELEISPHMAFSQLMFNMEALLKNEMVKHLKENTINLERLCLKKTVKKGERGINSKSLTIALDAFCDKFTRLKSEQIMLTANMALDPIDIFHNRFEIFNAEINALKVSGVEVQFNHFMDKSLEMICMFEQGFSIYEQGKHLDNGIGKRDLSLQALENNPITLLYASFVCRNGNVTPFSSNQSKVNLQTVKI